MSRKRLKLSKGLGDYVPLSVNFSSLDNEVENRNFEASDEGLCEQQLYDNQEYEELVVSVLTSLTGKEKLVFAFQLLRDSGYQIDHGSFAKVINISRRQYMRILNDIKLKTSLVVSGYYYPDGHKEQ